MCNLINKYIHTYIHTVAPMLLSSGNPLKYHEEDFICSLGSHLKVLTFLPLTGGCSAGLDLNTVIYDTANKNKTNATPRFELSTVQSPPRFATCTQKKRAVRARV